MNEPRWPELRSLRPGVIPLGPLSAGEIFTAALAVLRKHAGVLFGLSFVVVAAGQIAATAVLLRMPTHLLVMPAGAKPELLNSRLRELMPYTAALAALVSLTLLVVTGIAAVAVGKAVLGKPLGFGEALRELAPRALPLFGLSIVISVLATIGMLFFVVPGVWVFVLFSLAVPALMLEQATMSKAANRSRDLVRNHWWRTFAMVLGVVLAAYGIQVAVDWLVTQLAGPATTLLSPNLIGQIVATTGAAAYFGAVLSLVYVDRRFATDDLALELARAAGLKP